MHRHHDRRNGWGRNDGRKLLTPSTMKIQGQPGCINTMSILVPLPLTIIAVELDLRETRSQKPTKRSTQRSRAIEKTHTKQQIVASVEPMKTSTPRGPVLLDISNTTSRGIRSFLREGHLRKDQGRIYTREDRYFRSIKASSGEPMKHTHSSS